MKHNAIASLSRHTQLQEALHQSYKNRCFTVLLFPSLTNNRKQCNFMLNCILFADTEKELFEWNNISGANLILQDITG